LIVEAEAAYGSVTCLPGAFTLFRRKYLEDIEAETDSAPVQHINRAFSSATLANMRPQSFLYRKNSMNIPLTLSDFFSRKTTGIIERNLYELGEDRTLTVKFLERGLKCMYEPRAIAYTGENSTNTKCTYTVRMSRHTQSPYGSTQKVE
jgi:cellulose synthase/poly-beta-1,6-N-acetylglucosamine synthase-like glycosyltransferase